jgi:hypothetical protein
VHICLIVGNDALQQILGHLLVSHGLRWHTSEESPIFVYLSTWNFLSLHDSFITDQQTSDIRSGLTLAEYTSREKAITEIRRTYGKCTRVQTSAKWTSRPNLVPCKRHTYWRIRLRNTAQPLLVSHHACCLEIVDDSLRLYIHVLRPGWFYLVSSRWKYVSYWTVVDATTNSSCNLRPVLLRNILAVFFPASWSAETGRVQIRTQQQRSN